MPGRKDGHKHFMSFLAVHSSIAQANRKWRQLHPAHKRAYFAIGGPGEGGGDDAGRSGDGLGVRGS